jgi:hypothetical protein
MLSGLAQRLARKGGQSYKEQKKVDEVIVRPWHVSQREEIIRKAMAAGMTHQEATDFALSRS